MRHPEAEANAVLSNIERRLDSFDSLAKPILEIPTVARMGPGDQVSQKDLQRLSLEGVAAAALFQSFCRACPVRDHRRHTAYLSLASGNVIGDEMECQMAVQSRIKGEKDLIWLKVVSGVYKRDHSPAQDPGHLSPVATEESLPVATDRPDHKRSQPYDAELPPSKAQRPATGQNMRRLTGPTTDRPAYLVASPIRFCPEYLAQHEGPNLLAMQMGDASSVLHRIYFLPASLRPREDSMPISLNTLLRERRNLEITRRGSANGVFWIIRVARLVAEAFLRFDRYEPRGEWDKEDIVFYNSESNTPDLEPFLRVRMETQEKGAPETDCHPSSGARRRALLHLGFILLQLGLLEPVEMSPHVANEETCQQYILGQVKRVQIPGEYAEVIRSCAAYLPGDDEENTGEEDFRQKYYRFIISPLKQMESNLKAIRQGEQ